MSFTNETTHYSIPLPLGTDLTTPMDYNEAAQAVDTALFGAVQDSATATADAAEAKSTAQGAVDDVTALTGRVGTLEGTVATQGGAITRNANDITDVRRDLSDAIEASVEPNATATYAHAVKDLFWYNDTLYRTTAPIAVGDTIVPDTNCTTTTVATELARIEGEITTPSADGVTFDPTGTTYPASATDVDKALKAVAPAGDVSVTAQSGETYADVLTRLTALVDFNKITRRAVVAVGTYNFVLSSLTSNTAIFSMSLVATSQQTGSISTITIGQTIGANAMNYATTPAIAVADTSSTPITVGTVYTLYY